VYLHLQLAVQRLALNWVTAKKQMELACTCSREMWWEDCYTSTTVHTARLHRRPQTWNIQDLHTCLNNKFYIQLK